MGSNAGRQILPDQAEKIAQERVLLENIAAHLPDLEALLVKVNDRWVHDDLIYRFYHQSFKVYGLQSYTLEIVESLQSLLPHLPLNRWFTEIVGSGTAKEFRDEDNLRWPESTRPIVEAFFHARYFLEMICKYGKQLKEPPQTMPSGWAAVLYLYNIR
jgi:hypothetical protein